MRCWFALLFVTLCLVQVVLADEIDDRIAMISKVGPQGVGSSEAVQARQALEQLDAAQLPRLLPALNTSNIVAANWYRSIFDAIVTREFAKSTPSWPNAELKSFVQRPQGEGRARRLVLNLVERLEPGFRDLWIPKQLGDPEFRNDAVDSALAAGEKAKSAGESATAAVHFREAFKHARESDQVLRAARNLKDVGQDADPIRHLGFIHRWYLLGPFEAPAFTGFDQSFPPEATPAVADLSAQFQGKDDQKLSWKLHESKDSLGQLDLVAAIGAVRESVGYAYCEIDSPQQQRIQVRCSADDNLSVWLNGAKILAQRQWLNGTRLDRFSVSANLEKGPNRILVKICQGPQHVNPEVPNNWSFQLRLCDATGAGISFTNSLPTFNGQCR